MKSKKNQSIMRTNLTYSLIWMKKSMKKMICMLLKKNVIVNRTWMNIKETLKSY